MEFSDMGGVAIFQAVAVMTTALNLWLVGWLEKPNREATTHLAGGFLGLLTIVFTLSAALTALCGQDVFATGDFSLNGGTAARVMFMGMGLAGLMVTWFPNRANPFWPHYLNIGVYGVALGLVGLVLITDRLIPPIAPPFPVVS